MYLPGNIVEDERASASYNVAEGIITAKVPKETPSEHFPDLDMLSKLLARRGETVSGASNVTADISESGRQPVPTGRRTGAPLIEVLSEDEETNETDTVPSQAIEDGRHIQHRLALGGRSINNGHSQGI